MPSISLELAARLDGPADVANSVLDLGQACFEFWVENPRALPMQDAVLTAFISYHRNAVNTLAVNLTHLVHIADSNAIELGSSLRSRYQRLSTASFNSPNEQLNAGLLQSMRLLYNDLRQAIVAGGYVGQPPKRSNRRGRRRIDPEQEC
mgnify:CR=1 FL=1